MIEPSAVLIAQRAARTERIKQVFKEKILKEHPDASESLVVEILPDAAIDLFTLEIIDATEENFAEFLQSLREAKAEPFDPDDDDDDN